MAKKLDLSEKKFRPLRTVAVERKICATPTASPLKARNLKFRNFDEPHTQNFEIRIP
jgi:hypothetical protein